MKRRALLSIGGTLALSGCLSTLGDLTGRSGSDCQPIETETACEANNRSLLKAEPGAPIDSYRESVLLRADTLPRCERKLAERAVEDGTLQFCGNGPPVLRSFAQRAAEAAEDHELYLGYRGTGYRLYVQILDQVFVG